MNIVLSFLLVALSLAGCQGLSRDERRESPVGVGIEALQKNPGSDIDILPIAYAPRLDAELVYSRSLPGLSSGAWVTGLPGAAAAGVNQVCALNPVSGANACFPTHATPQGLSFGGILPATSAGQWITLWTNGPGYLPGGPGLNSIEKRVQRWTTRFPNLPLAMQWVRAPRPEATGLYLADAESGLFFFPESELTKQPEAASPLHFTRENGLGEERIVSMAPDGEGGLWLAHGGNATATALTRLTYVDGRAVFERHAVDPAVESAGGILKMIPDGPGRFWIAARLGTVLVRMQVANGRPAYTVFRPLGYGSAVPISDLIPDGRGGLWVALAERGIVRLRFEGEEARIDLRLTAADGLPDDPRLSLARAGANRFWCWGLFATEVARVIDEGDSVRVERYTTGSRVTALAETAGGRLWLARSRPARVALAEVSDGALQERTIWSESEDGGSAIYGIHPGGPDEIWFSEHDHGGERGRFRKLTLSAELPDLRTYENDPDRGGLPSNVIRGIVPDDEGGAWLYAGQLLRMTIREEHTRFATIPELRDYGIISVNAMEVDGEGGLWFGGWNGSGLLCRLRRSGERRELRCFGERDGLPAGYVRQIARNRRGEIFAAFSGDAVVRATPDGGGLRFSAFTAARHLPGYRLGNIAPDSEGGFWMVAVAEGREEEPVVLARWDDRGRLHTYRGADLPAGDAGLRIHNLAPNRSGGVWLATSRGVIDLAIVAGQIAFSSYFPISLFELRMDPLDGSLLGTVVEEGYFGLARVHRAEDSLIVSRVAPGISRSNVPFFSAGIRGDIWVGTSGSGVFLLTR